MIGKRLKKLREEYNMLQKELALKLSLSQQTISLYESNRRQPDYETLKVIADFFDVSIDYLLGRTNERNKDDIPIEEIYSKVNDVEEAMKVILSQPGLMLNGEMLSDESKIILANSILNGIRTVKELEEKKNKKKSDADEKSH